MLAYLPFAWPVLAHFSLSCQLSLKTAEEMKFLFYSTTVKKSLNIITFVCFKKRHLLSIKLGQQRSLTDVLSQWLCILSPQVGYYVVS